MYKLSFEKEKKKLIKVNVNCFVSFILLGHLHFVVHTTQGDEGPLHCAATMDNANTMFSRFPGQNAYCA